MANCFTMRREYVDAINSLPEADRQAMWNAVFDYVFNDKDAIFDGIYSAIFTLIKFQIEEDNRQANKAKRGGAPVGNQNARKTTQKQPENNLENNLKQLEKQPENNLNEVENNPNNSKTTETTQKQPKNNLNEVVFAESGKEETEERTKEEREEIKNKNKNNITHVCAYAREVRVTTQVWELPNKDEAVLLWGTVKSILEQEVHSLGFDVWIEPLRPLGFMDEALVILAPSEKSADEVEIKYVDTINSILRRINK